VPVPPSAVLHPEDVEHAAAHVPARPARATAPTARGAGSGAILDPRTWKQGLEALRDYTARR
jgi:hypothetical protein